MYNIVFRADGSSETGMGHIMRSLATAQMLQNDFTIAFAIFDVDASVKNIISSYNYRILELAGKKDEKFVDRFDAAVIDGYWFDNNYIKELKKSGTKIIQIDDLAGSEFFADIVINHAIGSDYSSSKFFDCKHLLTGSEYALLRPEFFKAAETKRIATQLESVTISMGGADPHNFSLSLLQALKDILAVVKINVLVGNACSHKKSLEEFIVKNPEMLIHIQESLNAEEMVKLFQTSSLFICPASTVAYEALAVRVPTACFLTAENQQSLYKGLVNTKSVKGLGGLPASSEKELQVKLSNVFLEYAELVKISEQQHVIDGLSGKRIGEAILSLWN